MSSSFLYKSCKNAPFETGFTPEFSDIEKLFDKQCENIQKFLDDVTCVSKIKFFLLFTGFLTLGTKVH